MLNDSSISSTDPNNGIKLPSQVPSIKEAHMKYIEMANASISPNPHGDDDRKLYDTLNAQVMIITLKPGESLKPHITPVDAIFYVLEGQGIVEVGDEKQLVSANTLIAVSSAFFFVAKRISVSIDIESSLLARL